MFDILHIRRHVTKSSAFEFSYPLCNKNFPFRIQISFVMYDMSKANITFLLILMLSDLLHALISSLFKDTMLPNASFFCQSFLIGFQ